MSQHDQTIIERGVLTLSDKDWAEAKRRSSVILPLAGGSRIGRQKADEAARALGLSRRQVYELVRRARQGIGCLTDMAPTPPSGGKGKSRLSEAVEKIITEVIQKLYLHRQKRSKTVVYREISLRCQTAGLTPPSKNTIRNRISQLDNIVVSRKRDGNASVRSLQPAAGGTPEVPFPLHTVQMDHTKIDLIIVEENSREPIGRPYLTLAIDVFSRCILGMVVTLEAPSATSVGLCLAHMVTDKQPWIEQLGIEAEWPMYGKSETLYLDNAAEFKSEALRRGCEQYGIHLRYRPPGKPHYGGIIERVIGTLMRQVHELPGTTFSNIACRGDYDSDATAALTLRELEKWLTLAVTVYHGTVHSTFGQTPASLWKEGQTLLLSSPRIFNAKEFLIDFLPVIRRSIGRRGFQIDNITYYADCLRPWIADRSRLDKFIIRRDPRDLSRIWVLDPCTSRYFEIPYRTLANPAVTLWEHRKAIRKLRDRGINQVDEALLFRTISQMRAITETAVVTRKSTRRDKERRRHLRHDHNIPTIEPPIVATSATIQPFDEIEEW